MMTHAAPPCPLQPLKRTSDLGLPSSQIFYTLFPGDHLLLCGLASSPRMSTVRQKAAFPTHSLSVAGSPSFLPSSFLSSFLLALTAAIAHETVLSSLPRSSLSISPSSPSLDLARLSFPLEALGGAASADGGGGGHGHRLHSLTTRHLPCCPKSARERERERQRDGNRAVNGEIERTCRESRTNRECLLLLLLVSAIGGIKDRNSTGRMQSAAAAAD